MALENNMQCGEKLFDKELKDEQLEQVTGGTLKYVTQIEKDQRVVVIREGNKEDVEVVRNINGFVAPHNDELECIHSKYDADPTRGATVLGTSNGNTTMAKR